MNVTWASLSPLFRQLGLPMIAWVLDKVPAMAGEAVKTLPFGGIFSGAVEGLARSILTGVVKQLGLDPATATAEDVKVAVETGQTSDVVASLREVENRAAMLTPLVDMFKSDNETDVKLAEVNANTFLAVHRAEAASDNFWMSLYRPILMAGCTACLLYLIGLVLYAATLGGPTAENVIGMKEILMAVFAALVGPLLGHFAARSSERKALLAPVLPQNANNPAAPTVVVNQEKVEKAPPTPKKKRV